MQQTFHLRNFQTMCAANLLYHQREHNTQSHIDCINLYHTTAACMAIYEKDTQVSLKRLSKKCKII